MWLVVSVLDNADLASCNAEQIMEGLDWSWEQTGKWLVEGQRSERPGFHLALYLLVCNPGQVTRSLEAICKNGNDNSTYLLGLESY